MSTTQATSSVGQSSTLTAYNRLAQINSQTQQSIIKTGELAKKQLEQRQKEKESESSSWSWTLGLVGTALSLISLYFLGKNAGRNEVLSKLPQNQQTQINQEIEAEKQTSIDTYYGLNAPDYSSEPSVPNSY